MYTNRATANEAPRSFSQDTLTGQRWILSLLSVTVIAALSACGGGTGGNTSSQAGAETAAIQADGQTPTPTSKAAKPVWSQASHPGIPEPSFDPWYFPDTETPDVESVTSIINDSQPDGMIIVGGSATSPQVWKVTGSNTKSRTILCKGTAARPIYIVGAKGSTINAPGATGGWRVVGEYCVLDSLTFDNSLLSVAHNATGNGANTNHITVRHTKVLNSNSPNSWWAAGVTGLNGAPGATVSDIVFRDVEISNTRPTTAKVNGNGFQIQSTPARVSNVWFIDSRVNATSGITNNKGSGIVVYPQSATTNEYIDHIYISNNDVTGNDGIPISITGARDVVVSNNTANAKADLPCFYHKTSVERGWYLFNKCSGGSDGFRISTDALTRVAENLGGDHALTAAIIGNTVSNTTGSGVWAIPNGSTRKIYVIGNTFHNVGNGIYSSGTSFETTEDELLFEIANNIISDVKPGGRHHSFAVASGRVSALAELYSGNSGTQTMPNDVGNFGCINCRKATNSSGIFDTSGNLTLAATSEAIDAGVESAIYGIFKRTYGIDIRRDATANAIRARPAGNAWDIGAYEYGATQAPSTPMATGIPPLPQVATVVVPDVPQNIIDGLRDPANSSTNAYSLESPVPNSNYNVTKILPGDGQQLLPNKIYLVTGTQDEYKRWNCSSASPTTSSVVRGIPGHKVTNAWQITGTNCVFENLSFNNARIEIVAHGGYLLTDGIVVRDSEFRGAGPALHNSSAISVYSDASATTNHAVRNVVVQRTLFQGNFQRTCRDISGLTWRGPTSSSLDCDYVAVKAGSSSAAYVPTLQYRGTVSNLWVVDSSSSELSSEIVQLDSGNQVYSGEAKSNVLDHAYVGRNIATRSRQGGIWLKTGEHIVVSGNIVFGMKGANYDSGGYCYGQSYSPDYTWFLSNTCADAYQGFISAGSNPASFDESTGRHYGENHTYLIGNRVYRQHGNGDFCPDGYSGIGSNRMFRSGFGEGCLAQYSSSAFLVADKTCDPEMLNGFPQYPCPSTKGQKGEVHIANNSMYDIDWGVNSHSPAVGFIAWNNIILKPRGGHVLLRTSTNIATGTPIYSLADNLYGPTTDGAEFRSAFSEPKSGAVWTEDPGTSGKRVSNTGQFVAPEIGDLRLASGSKAIDAGTSMPTLWMWVSPYVAFGNTVAGISISYDMLGRQRPFVSGGKWDAGAHELQ